MDPVSPCLRVASEHPLHPSPRPPATATHRRYRRQGAQWTWLHHTVQMPTLWQARAAEDAPNAHLRTRRRRRGQRQTVGDTVVTEGHAVWRCSLSSLVASDRCDGDSTTRGRLAWSP